jgi:hypothetical protein
MVTCCHLFDNFSKFFFVSWGISAVLPHDLAFFIEY